jgi:putative toxin-antitoxin system antitoxin component (TIGR02293 family)
MPVAPSTFRPFPSIAEANGARLLDVQARRLVEAVREGFPFEAFERFRGFLDVPARRLGKAMAVAERTLARRKKRGRFTTEESDRLLRLARLAEMALAVFEGNEMRARRWLTGPKSLLNGEPPLERADTEAGAREVEDMLFTVEFTGVA